MLNKIGVPGVYGFIKDHKQLLKKAKESKDLCVFIGDIKSEVVNNKFMKFLEISKQMIYNDDLKFGYVDLQKYLGRDYKLLQLEKTDQVVMFRR